MLRRAGNGRPSRCCSWPEQAATGGAPPAGHYELTLASGPGRVVMAAFACLLGVIGLGLLVLSVLIVATSTPGNPAPVGQYVVLGGIGAIETLRDAARFSTGHQRAAVSRYHD